MGGVATSRKGNQLVLLNTFAGITPPPPHLLKWLQLVEVRKSRGRECRAGRGGEGGLEVVMVALKLG